jgi:hypothetical protein
MKAAVLAAILGEQFFAVFQDRLRRPMSTVHVVSRQGEATGIAAGFSGAEPIGQSVCARDRERYS